MLKIKKIFFATVDEMIFFLVCMLVMLMKKRKNIFQMDKNIFHHNKNYGDEVRETSISGKSLQARVSTESNLFLVNKNMSVYKRKSPGKPGLRYFFEGKVITFSSLKLS